MMDELSFNFNLGDIPDEKFDVKEEELYIEDKFKELSNVDEFYIKIAVEELINSDIRNRTTLDNEIKKKIPASKLKKISSPEVENKSTTSNFVENKSSDVSSMFMSAPEEPEDYFVFFPSKRDMRTEYPELGTVIEFKDLTNRELVFVWYFANQTSPYFSIIDHKHKVALCIKEAFGKTLEPNTVDNYISGNFPEKIRIAIQKMNRYNPSVRMKAKMMYEKILADWQVILSKDTSKMSLAERKGYIDLTQKISSNLSDLVGQIEESFGVRIQTRKDTSVLTEMDLILSEEQSNDGNLIEL